MISVYDTVRDLIKSDKFKTINVVKGDSNYTSCNTMYMVDGDILISSEGYRYQVSNLTVINSSFELTPKDEAPIFLGGFLKIERDVFFIEGKPLTTNKEWEQASTRSKDKLPLIWLVTNYTESFGNEESGIVSASNVLMYFMDVANEPKWTTEQHYDNTIKVMRNLVNRFRILMDDDSSLTRNSFNAKPWERFGRQDSKGSRKKIIDEDLSGYEVLTSFDIRGCINC